MKFNTQHCVILSTLLISLTQNTWALDQIIRPYQSVRSAAMGGVRMVTGLYDENFFNNPARVTANPRSRFTLLQLTPVEYTAATLAAQNSILSGTEAFTVASQSGGKNIHSRFQFILPAYYHAAINDRKFAFAAGLITSVQVDAALRQSYQMNLGGIADIGPAITIGRKFLMEDRLSVGVTSHLIYRVSFTPNYGLVDYVKGTPLSLSSLGGEGAMVDFDIGSTYKITRFGLFHLEGGVAVQNALGGTYSNLNLSPLKLAGKPPAQNRSLGAGLSLTRSTWRYFTDTTFAIEATDLLNNTNGSWFRLLHLGAETHWHSLAFRAGINQGYLGGGVGLDFRYFTLDLATYGEELGLNTGQIEDRRYTATLGFHI